MLDDGELIEPRIRTKKVDASILVFHDDQDAIITLCKHPFNGNPEGCPNFGTTWNCPPRVPSIAEIKSHFYTKCRDIHIVFMRVPVIDANGSHFPKSSLQLQYSFISSSMKAFFKKLKNRFPDALLLHGPACRYCMESGIGSCTCPNEPCRYPEMWTYPPEAVGIDITGTMENAGIPFDVTMKSSVTRVGIACFACPVDLPRLVEEFAQREGKNHDKNTMV